MVRLVMRRAFEGRAFLIPIAAGLLIAVWHFWQEVLPLRQYLGQSPTGTSLPPASLYRYWLGADMESVPGYVLLLALPILVILPNGVASAADARSGYEMALVTRAPRSKVALAHAIGSFVSGAVVGVFPFLLSLLFTSCVLPAIRPIAATGTNTIFATSMWADMYYIRPSVYVGCYLVLIGVWCGTLSVVASAMGCWKPRLWVVLLLPFLALMVIEFLLGGLFPIWHGYSPLAFLRPDQLSGAAPLGIVISLALMIAFSFLSFFIWVRRGESLA